MRVIMRFENPDDQSAEFGWKKETAAVYRYKARVNKSKEFDYLFNASGEVVLTGIQFKPDKNILYFRPASLDEEENLKSARRKNALRGCAFAVMAILLPCAHMSFENTRRPFTKIKFVYAEGQDLVLYLRGDQYRVAVEPRQTQSEQMGYVYGEPPVSAVEEGIAAEASSQNEEIIEPVS